MERHLDSLDRIALGVALRDSRAVTLAALSIRSPLSVMICLLSIAGAAHKQGDAYAAGSRTCTACGCALGP